MILLLAAVAILGGVVLAALGRAGEMAAFRGDYTPPDLDEVSAADVALLRPPTALWGYNVQATEEALQLIARSMTARDVEIAMLRRELADLRGGRAGKLGEVRAPGPEQSGGGPRAWPEHPAGEFPPWPDRPGGEIPPWPTLPKAGSDD